MARIDHYQAVTDTLIETLEKGVAPWQKDWQGQGGIKMPRRVNGEYYRGINVMMLICAAIDKGYNSAHWMTYRAAASMGGQVRKGEKASRIYKPVIVDKVKGDKESGKICIGLSADSVFNADQIDGLDSKFYAMPEKVIDTGAKEDSEMESFFAATGATIKTEGNQPCFIPALDVIKMPKIQQFNSAAAYYGTLAHETIHWTGHATRLDRLKSGKKEYAYEELIAELGSLFVCGIIGATPNFDNSAAYIKSWLAALRDDKKFIFNAARDAQAATDYLIELTGHEMPIGEEYKAA